MKILLPTLHVRPSAQAIPLAAACLKAALPPQLQRRTELLSLQPQQTEQQMLELILQRQPDLIAFPLYLWNRGRILALCRQLRQQSPDLWLVAGGPEASADSRAVIAEGDLSGVIRGEGEEGFTALAEQLATGRSPAAAGFCAAGLSEQTPLPAPGFCRELEQLASPHLGGLLPPVDGGMLWEVARGCPFDCAFCYDAKGAEGVRPFPFERLEAELELFTRQGVEQIWVLDSTFNAPAERGRRLLELLLKKAPQIHYHLEAKADFLDPESIDLLGRLNCSLQIGLQSTDNRVLKPLGRRLDLQRLQQQARQLSALGITFGFDLIYGLPQDNHRGFCRSLDQTLQLEPNQIDIFPLAVLPGTKLFQQQDRYAIRAAAEPPYLVQENRSYSAAELADSRLLAAATDIFFNRGRAVGFFLPLCQALQLQPVQFLEQFAAWLQQREGSRSLEAEAWQPQQVLPLQEEFSRQLLHKQQPELIDLCLDLIRFHYHYAETLLAPELPDTVTKRLPADLTRHPWRRATQLRLVEFNYELNELMELEGGDLRQLARQLSPAGSTGLFCRRRGELLIESLTEEFARLLSTADGRQTPRQLLPELPQPELEEITSFAVAQGLLVAAT